MVRLTEEMIVARTRVSDMGNVKKLNCWGAELTDISILRKLVNVEVLSLSVNCISSLSDIQNCKNLQELYIRKNKIPDLSEICWLRDLPKLKSLWLEENPCVQDQGELYRLTVIRTLPQLQKLDNVAVQSDEMADAVRRGMELVHPLDRDPLQPTFNSYQPPQPISRESLPRSNGSHKEDYEDRFSPGRDDSNPHQQHFTGFGSTRKPSQASMGDSTYYTPSRRVSNQVFETNSILTSKENNQMARRNSPASHEISYGGSRSAYAQDEAGSSNYVPEYHTGRRYSQQEVGNVRHSPRMSQTSIDENLRRMSVHDPVYEDDRNNANNFHSMIEQQPSTRGSGGSYHQMRGGSNYGQSVPPPQSYGYSGPASDMPQSYGYQQTGGYFEYNQRSQPHTMETNNEGKNENGNLHQDSNSTSNVSNSSSEKSDSPKTLTRGESENSSARAILARHYEQTYDQVNQQIESAQQHIARRKSYSPDRQRRPKNRNSNILSAVLCLIKELDGPSLEVAEMAVRCRIEELND